MIDNGMTKTENIIDDLVKNKLFVLLTIFLFVLIASILTSFQKKEYSSTAKILIIQEQEHKMDAYLASKSSESLAKNLKKAISTSSFRNKVLEDLSDVEIGVFQNEKKRRKEWLKMVNIKTIPNTSILEITSYHKVAFQSEKILNKVLNTLLENHQLYHGGDTGVRLEIIDNPLTSLRPTRPNWALNLSLSFVLGIFFVITLLVLFPNKINLLDAKLRKKPTQKNKDINEKKGNFKVFDYLEGSSNKQTDLPDDLFEEDEESEEESFFEKEEGLFNSQGEEDNIIEVENNKEIKEIIGNNHYLKRK
jgi:capsular polysaccharide biosynthesis protein